MCSVTQLQYVQNINSLRILELTSLVKFLVPNLLFTFNVSFIYKVFDIVVGRSFV